jgi:hypothetical protein
MHGTNVRRARILRRNRDVQQTAAWRREDRRHCSVTTVFGRLKIATERFSRMQTSRLEVELHEPREICVPTALDAQHSPLVVEVRATRISRFSFAIRDFHVGNVSVAGR